MRSHDECKNPTYLYVFWQLTKDETSTHKPWQHGSG